MREESGVASSLSSLPSGGGGVSPLGDRFEPDLLRGSGSYAVALHCPKGPNEVRPSLSLAYSTGSGNGAFGLGWRLNLLRIERRSDRGVPGYTDDDEFVIGGAEVLVPVGGNRYRPKTETKFWMIERVGDGWRIRTGDGRTLLFGQTAASREESDGHIFAWCLDEERDPAGIVISYAYRRDGGSLYPLDIRYGIFRVSFVYEPRPDTVRNGRGGFLRTTALRTARVELHCSRLAPSLMRSYAFVYVQAANDSSLLSRVELSAGEGEHVTRAPALSFEYSTSDFTAWRVHQIEAFTPPPSLEQAATQLVDLTGDGLPDILESLGSRMFLWRNRGDGTLDGPERVDGVPSTVSLARGNVAFADLDADGRVDLFAVDQPLQLAFHANGRGGFADDPVVFQQRPTVRLSASDTRLVDVDGDGVTDLLTTGRDHFLLFRHEPGVGFSEPDVVARDADLDRFPDVTFGDRGVRLANMTGDGLTAMVVVRSGDVSYWPSLGNGVWGSRVPMENPPQFPPGYRDERVHLVDLDGDGCADIVYIDSDETVIWLNRSGIGFTDPIVIPFAPRVATARILPADFFGDGRPGFLWTATNTGEFSTGYRFLRFDDGRKPYLMTAIDNGMGRRTTIEYSTSTAMRMQDDAEGRPWPGQLPFPVQVVREIRDTDTVFGSESQLAIRYHDGVYDGPEREFRGFSNVTVDYAGDDSIAATRQEYAFFHGDPDATDPAAREGDRALSGALVSMRMFERTGAGLQLRHENTQVWDTRVEAVSGAHTVFFPFLIETESREHSLVGSPDRVERTRLSDYDAHGNAGKRVRECFAPGAPAATLLRTEERFVYTNNEAAWLVRLPVRAEMRDEAGVPFSIKVQYYDGPAFTGRPEGDVSAGLLTRTQELALLESRLPAGYTTGRDFAALGYELTGAGDTRGYYATTLAVRRDANGNIVEQRDPMGDATVFVYDADGVYPVRKTDPRGKTTEVTFHAPAGEPARIALPDGRVFRSAFDALGRVIGTFEADDAGAEQLVKSWIIDTEHVPNSIVAFAPRAGGRTIAALAAIADLTTVADAAVAKIYFDGFGNSAMQVASGPDALGGGRRFIASGQRRLNARKMIAAEFPPAFVANFDLLPVPDPGAARRRFQYDARGDIIATEGPGPARSRIAIDTFSAEHFEDAGGGPAVRVERFDARNRVTQIEERESAAAHVIIAYDLTLDGRIQTIRDEAGNAIAEYTIAGPDEPIRIRHRDAGTRTYYRDAAGRVAELVRADGSSLFYRYDAGGRLIRLEHAPAGGGAAALVRDISYDIDPGAPAAGRFLDERIALVREPDIQVRYSYNRAGAIVREEVTAAGGALTTQWEYDLQREVVATTYPDGHRIANVVGASGAVQGIAGVLTRVSWNADGQNDGYRFVNGVEVEMPADPATQRLTGILARNGAATLRRLDYGYDTIGNVVTIVDETAGGIEHQTFAYDGLHRLTSVTARAGNAAGAVLRAEAFTYDAEGNLRRIGAPALTLTYGDATRSGRLTEVNDGVHVQPIAYDARGSIRAWGDLTSIELDALDRVRRIVTAAGDEVRFAYDPQNRRVLKQVRRDGLTSTIKYASGLFEQRADSAIRSIYLGSRLVATERVTGVGTEAEFFVFDHHGTLLTQISAAGAVLENQRYTPFGLALEAPSAIDRYLGLERDIETGLIQLGSRYYAPLLGRFISPDWFVLENPTRPMRMPQGFNVYSYSLNNPLAFKDPSGKWFFLVPFIVGFVAGLVYGLGDGQGWAAFGTALETGLTTGFGALLGGVALGGFGAVMGGINGLFTGLRKVYDWEHIEGWASFVADSSFGIIGTSLGNVLNIVNFVAGSSYRSDLSKRQNRQVYDKGFAFEGSAAFTQGNVISNLKGGGGAGILKHETVHILQNRLLGPLYTAGYIAWLVYGAYYGFWLGVVLWPFTGQDPLKTVRDIAYDDNPFEMWAYAVQGNDGQKGKLAIG